jgi:hypothetical protein
MDREEKLYRMFGKFYPQGTILYSENDPAEEMFYIQSGRLRVTTRAGTDRPVETRDIGAGDLLGEDSFVGQGRRKNMAEALEDSRLLVIGSGNVDSVVRNGPEIAEAIVRKLLDSLRGAWENLYDWQCSHAWKGVRENLESEGAGGTRSPGEVSAALGVEEFTVRMILEKMTQAGALAAEGGSYILQDASLLDRMRPADSAPAGEAGGR